MKSFWEINIIEISFSKIFIWFVNTGANNGDSHIIYISNISLPKGIYDGSLLARGFFGSGKKFNDLTAFKNMSVILLNEKSKIDIVLILLFRKKFDIANTFAPKWGKTK